MKLRTHIFIIAAATVLPTFLFLGFVLYLCFEMQRDNQMQNTVNTARALSLAVDTSFQRAIRTLNALSTSEHLQTGDLKSFYEESRRIISAYDGAETIALLDPAGRAVVSARHPFGKTLSDDDTDPDFVRHIAQSRRPEISNLSSKTLTQHPLVTAGVPVVIDGQIKYVLTIALSPNLFRGLMTLEPIPAGYVAAVIDGNKTIVARNKEAGKYIGEPAAPMLARESAGKTEGWWPNPGNGSEPTYAAHRRSEFSGWTVVIDVPRSEIAAPLWEALRIVLGAMILFLLCALGLAGLFGRRIVSSIRALAEGAKSLGASVTPRLSPSPICELDQVRLEIEAAAEKRERMEAVLRESEERLRAIIETEPECVKVVDPSGCVLEMNRAGLEMLQADSLATLKDKNLGEFVLPEYRPAFSALHERVLGGGSGTLEFEIVGLKGRKRWLETHATPLRGPSGDVVALLGVTRDITERKQAEERLRDEFELAKKITDSAAESIFVADCEGRITFANAEAGKMFGFSLDELIGQPLHQTLHHHYPDGRPFPQSECVLRYARASNQLARDVEQVFFRRDGSPINVECTAAPLQQQERDMGSVLVVRDITERKRLQDEIKTRADQLAMADRRKDEFLATLAHELRNPLAPVTNAVDILRMSRLSPEELQWATNLIDKQMHHMTRLVDDLLDVSRISQDRLELRRERIDLVAVVQRAIEMNEAAIKQRGHSVLFAPPPPIYVNGDEVRLTQVFANLVNNAAKFTDTAGVIRIIIGETTDRVSVSVSDSGIGIATEQLAHVFELFTQIDRSLERNHGGLGIGLNLAKRLVEMHGGSIEAQSGGPGQGSVFTVRLPMIIERRDVDKRPSLRSIAGTVGAAGSLRILIVDDNVDSAETLALLLRHRGNLVSMAHDGETAVQLAIDEKPDVVILDIGLPKINGYEACRQMRRQTSNRQAIIIALTGWSREEDRELTRAAGFDHHLVKPVSPSSVWRLIVDLTSRQKQIASLQRQA